MIVLTNGLYYILLEGKSIKKVSDITEATTFPSCNVAVKEVFAHKNKCKGYYPYDQKILLVLIREQNSRKDREECTRRKNAQSFIRKIMVNAIFAEKNFCIQK